MTPLLAQQTQQRVWVGRCDPSSGHSTPLALLPWQPCPHRCPNSRRALLATVCSASVCSGTAYTHSLAYNTLPASMAQQNVSSIPYVTSKLHRFLSACREPRPVVPQRSGLILSAVPAAAVAATTIAAPLAGALFSTSHAAAAPAIFTSGIAALTVAAAAPSTAAVSADLSSLLLAAAACPYRDAVCFVAAALGAVVWVKMFDILAAQGVLEQKLSRKLVHMTAGPFFVLTWPLFSALPTARLFAAVVPSINMIRLLSVGLGLVSDPGLVNSVSRSGDRSELLKGPLYYCIILIAATLLCWRDIPAGLVAVSLMCGGDGLADIVGRRLGFLKLPYNTGKSWAGSAAMFLGGMAMALGLFQIFCSAGYFPCLSASALVPAMAVICGVATFVESLPINDIVDDNLSVPGVAVVLSLLLLPVAASL